MCFGLTQGAGLRMNTLVMLCHLTQATYNKNRYDLPFASFVGVNHHGHSILLGCALLKNEDTDSFKWLFDCWLRCMGSKLPRGIITDQCPSMPNAISECMPTAVHRWCILHIMKKVPQKLNGLKRHNEIEHEMSQIVWSSHSKEVFEERWLSFISKHGLGANTWLSDLYAERYMWVPVYLDNHFWAGMRSTQRSESMHAFFNNFITRRSTLIQLGKQFDNCLGRKEQKEKEADVGDFYTNVPCATNSSIESQFERVYTNAKFREVQTQLRAKANCLATCKEREPGFVVYEVLEEVGGNRKNSFKVTYNSSSLQVKCECLLFESRGILCRHSLLVLSYERIESIPQCYILERWCKNIERRHSTIKSSYDEPILEPRNLNYDGMISRSKVHCEVASGCETLTTMVHSAYDKLEADMKEYKANSYVQSILRHEDLSANMITDLQSPIRIRSRGRPNKRLGSALEKKIAHKKKKKENIAPSHL